MLNNMQVINCSDLQFENAILSSLETFDSIPLETRSRESLTIANMSVSPKVVSCPRKGIQHSKEEGKHQHLVFCHPNAKWNDNPPASTRISGVSVPLAW